jgi:hypothetical protein
VTLLMTAKILASIAQNLSDTDNQQGEWQNCTGFKVVCIMFFMDEIVPTMQNAVIFTVTYTHLLF